MLEYIQQINKLSLGIDEHQLTDLVMNFERAEKIHLLGNGGSSAICSHLAVDLTKACDLVAFCYHDPSLLTCFSNDYGYDNAYAKIVEKYVTKDDCVVLISSRGESENILRAAHSVHEKEATLVTLSGFDVNNQLRSLACDQHFYVRSSNYNVVETMHQIILLQAVELLMTKK